MDAEWIVTKLLKNGPMAKAGLLIVGLPGIGNVGKIAVDVLIEEWNAKKICTFFSYSLPHSVFVNEKNLVELPSIDLYHKKTDKQDIFLLAGDVQPIDERSCYSFCEKVLDLCKEYGIREIVTLGGIGLQTIPKKPRVFCTATVKDLVQEYKKKSQVQESLYGLVGPIIGVSGLILGLAKQRNMKAATLLVETFGHPMYLKEVLLVLRQRFKLKIDMQRFDKEIAELESELLKKTKEMGGIGKPTRKTGQMPEEQNYIG